MMRSGNRFSSFAQAIKEHRFSSVGPSILFALDRENIVTRRPARVASDFSETRLETRH